MAKFIYVEFDSEGDKNVIISEEEILDWYWEYWSKSMAKVKRFPLITERNCIEDFCIVHWAQPYKD